MASETLQSLRSFFATAPAAHKATRHLGKGARVNLALDGGLARFSMATGTPVLEEGADADPDFTLQLPDGAVRRITSLQSDDLGEFGITFFQLVRERDPASKVRVRIGASTGRLVTHGYLGVLAAGGAKVAWWLLRNGIRNPKAAIDRLRGATG